LTVLVFGASGFIGRHLVPYLRRHGLQALPVMRECAKQRECAGSDDCIIATCKPERLSEDLAGVEFAAIVNLASYGVSPQDRDPTLAFEANVALPFALTALAAQRKIPLLHIGSVSEYAPVEAPHRLVETAPLETGALYGATKAAGMIAALAAARARGVAFAGLRLFNVYGSGESPHRLLPSLRERLSREERVPLSAGTQVRDFIHVDDVCDAIRGTLDFIGARGGAGVFNIATGTGVTVREFAEMTCQLLGKDLGLLGFGDIRMRDGENGWSVGDPGRTTEIIGWRAQITLKEGIARILSNGHSEKPGERL
jgi:nucleoside-diphosphate-sugar epimerase